MLGVTQLMVPKSAPGAVNCFVMTRSISSCAWGVTPLGCGGSASSTAGGIVNRPAASGTLQTNCAPNGASRTKENPEIWMNNKSGSVLPGGVQITVNPCERVTLVTLLSVEEL